MQLVILTSLAVLVCNSVPTLASTKFVTPDSSTPCPDERYCYRLQEVIHNTRVYFASNTTLKFLPGIYNIETESSVVVSDVTGLAIVGNNTTVQCFENFGLVFLNISNLTIQHLRFTDCGLNVFSGGLMNIANTLTDVAQLIRDRIIPKQNLHSPLYLVQVYDLNINRVVINSSKGCGILGINILGNSSLIYSSFSGNMLNAFFIYQDLARDISAFAAVNFSVLAIMHSKFELGITKFKDSSGGLTLTFLQKFYHVSMKINNATFLENKGITCSSIFVGTSKCSSVAIVMDVVTVDGGVCLTNDTSVILGDLLLVYRTKQVSSCKKKTQMLHISRGNFSKNSQRGQRKQPSVHIAAEYDPPTSLIVSMADIVLSKNMGSGLFITNVMSPVLLQSVFISGNVNIGVEIRHSTVTFSGKTTLTENRDKAFYITESNVTFTGSLYIERNSALKACIFALDGSNVTFAEHTSFYENFVWKTSGRSLCVRSRSNVTFSPGRTEFINNQFGGAIYVHSSYLNFHGIVNISGNQAYSGGGLSLYSGAIMIINPNTYINFTGNRAAYEGGAIFVHDKYYYSANYDGAQCFFLWPEGCEYVTQSTSAEMYFQGNYARIAGSALYGGSVDTCLLKNCKHYKGNRSFFNRTHFAESAKELSLISSDATRVCICNGSCPDCTILNYTLAAYPGQTVLISAVAVGQGLGTSPATIHGRFINSGAEVVPELGELQASQFGANHCKNFSYTVSSPNEIEGMLLSVEKDVLQAPVLQSRSRISYKSVVKYKKTGLRDSKFIKTPVLVTLQLQRCPLGFQLHNKTYSCSCHSTLVENNIQCDINTQMIHRPSPVWMQAVNPNNSTSDIEIIIHKHCPFDYCKSSDIELNLKEPDKQCDSNRSGTLCGGCQSDFSQVLGSSRCLECSNIWLLLIVPLALTGILLVGVLVATNLTVSVGTIDGLIFYANLVQPNKAIIFPGSSSSSFLSIFIAWLNLDLGIETCFYSGLDAYAKTWLQFVFPIYIWLIMTMIIVFSHYSTTVARLSGRNAVPVLATLFLLSYTKLLRTIITAFSFTVLEGKKSAVWLYDGNVLYLQGKHVPLFLAALLLLLTLSLPYTTLLLLAPLLQKSKHRALFWMAKLKPLFDAYMGPYKDNCRYSVGLLLLARVILFLVFSANVFGDPAVNLLAIIAMVICICIHRMLVSGVYKRQYLNAIEYSFLVSIIILSSSALYTTRNNDGKQDIAAYISAGIAFVMFIAIILYHLWVAIKGSRVLKQTRDIMRKLFQQEEHPALDPWNEEHPYIAVDHETIPVNRANIRPLIVDLSRLRQPLEFVERSAET